LLLTCVKTAPYHINDLIDNNGQIAKLEFLARKFKLKIKQMEYNSIIHAIPTLWKKDIKKSANIAGKTTVKECQIAIDNKLCNIQEISTKEIYNHILNDKCKPPTSKKRWIELNNDMDVEDSFWNLIYSTPFQLTRNSKVLMVQYKLIHRILAVNHNLKKWKRIDSDICDFCNEIDTIDHFIYHCETSSKLWQSILLWWKNSFEFSIPITALEIIFGIPNENNDHEINLLNTIILYGKYYIYTLKKQKKDLTLYDFLLTVKQELKFKKSYYYEHNRPQTYLRKWAELEDKL
jgi:hypothetical protein